MEAQQAVQQAVQQAKLERDQAIQEHLDAETRLHESKCRVVALECTIGQLEKKIRSEVSCEGG
jgi:hypothetical protein